MNTLRLEIINLQVISRSLFVRWFNTYAHHDLYYIQTAEGMMEGQMNFMAIISRKDNPRMQEVIKEFEDTVSFVFD